MMIAFPTIPVSQTQVRAILPAKGGGHIVTTLSVTEEDVVSSAIVLKCDRFGLTRIVGVIKLPLSRTTLYNSEAHQCRN